MRGWDFNTSQYTPNNNTIIPAEDIVGTNIYFSPNNPLAERLLPQFGRYMGTAAQYSLSLYLWLPNTRYNVQGAHNDWTNRFYHHRFFLFPGLKIYMYKYSSGTEMNYTSMSAYFSKSSDNFYAG